MSHAYTPDPTNNPDSITIPDDGDDIDAASVNVGFEGLADQVAYTQAQYSIEPPGVRLTYAHADSYTRVPISDTSSVSAIGLEYFDHQRIPLWDGSKWVSHTIQPLATNQLTLSGLTSGKLYDVFAYLSSGNVRLELSAAWTNDVTRADALAVNPALSSWKGLVTKLSDPTRLYVGTIRATGATTTADTKAKRFIWNFFNRVSRTLQVKEAAASWTMAAGAIRQANLNGSNQVEFVLGFGDVAVEADLRCMAQISGTNREVGVHIGLDSVVAESTDSTFSGFASQATGIADQIWSLSASYRGYPGFGWHRLTWLEHCTNATATFYGSASPSALSGLVGSISG